MGQVQLKPDEEAGIDRVIAAGRFPSREAVVAEGLRLVLAREARLEIEAKVAEGLADLAAGRSHTIEEVRAHFAHRRFEQE